MKRQIRTKEKVTNQSEHKARKTKGKKSINKEVFKSLFMGVTAIRLGGTTSPEHSQLLKLKNKKPKFLHILLLAMINKCEALGHTFLMNSTANSQLRHFSRSLLGNASSVTPSEPLCTVCRHKGRQQRSLFAMYEMG